MLFEIKFVALKDAKKHKDTVYICHLFIFKYFEQGEFVSINLKIKLVRSELTLKKCIHFSAFI